MDEVVLTISGVKHWLWRAVDQTGRVLDILVQGQRDTQVTKRLLRKLLKRHCRGSAYHGDRQTGQLRCCEDGDHARCRAPHA